MVLAVNTNNEADYYVNDMLNLSCTASGFTEIGFLGIFEDNQNYNFGCYRQGSEMRGYGSANSFGFPLISHSECGSLANGKPSGFTLAMSVVITEQLEGFVLDCEAKELDSSAETVNSEKKVFIDNIKGKLYEYIGRVAVLAIFIMHSIHFRNLSTLIWQHNIMVHTKISQDSDIITASMPASECNTSHVRQ